MGEKAQFNLTTYNYQLTQDLEQYAKVLHKRDVNIFCRGLYTDYQYTTPSPSPPRPVFSASPQNWPMNNFSRNLYSEDISRSSGSPRFPTAFSSAYRSTYGTPYSPFPMAPRAPCFPQYRPTAEHNTNATSNPSAEVKVEPTGQE